MQYNKTYLTSLIRYNLFKVFGFLLVLASVGCLVAADDAPAENKDSKLDEALQAGIKQAQEAVHKLGEQLKQALNDIKLPTLTGGDSTVPDATVGAVKDARKRRSMMAVSSSSSSESKEIPPEATNTVVEALNV